MDNWHKALGTICLFLMVTLGGLLYSGAYCPIFTWRFSFLGAEFNVQAYDMKEDNRVMSFIIRTYKQYKEFMEPKK